MKSLRLLAWLLLLSIAIVLAPRPGTLRAGAAEQPNLVFACRAENDLYRVVTAGGAAYPRYDTPLEAVRAARAGAGVLMLADEYPQKTTPVEPAVFDHAAQKKLRLYVEYSSTLPGIKVGTPQPTQWERAVVASDAFGPPLKRLRILAIHGCRFVPVEAERPHLVVARVAGFDTAIFGLDDTRARPILFEHPRGDMLVATTGLSHFVTARYAPKEAWQAVWRMVLAWLRPGVEPPALDWTPTVRPTFTRDQVPPEDARLQAIRRGATWYGRARLFVHESWREEIGRQQEKNPDWMAPGPKPEWPQGDGRHGLLEGQGSIIYPDGSQPGRWLLRADCNAESAMGLAMHALVDDDPRSRTVAANLLDFVYFKSELQQGPRADPKSPSYGLLGWFCGPRGSGTYFGDDNAKAMLATMAAAAALRTDRWDEPLLRCILGNLRTTGTLGFRSHALGEADLQKHGWEHFARRRLVHPSPHYESWLWACYLWLYDKTRYEPLLQQARSGISITMQSYPRGWIWTNEQQQIERARMLLPLAWLIRVEDKPEYREWLGRVSGDLLARQDASGAIQEQIAGALQSNAQYGTTETSLLQTNGDPACDMLYVSNFALVGLNEAAAATGDAKLARAADRLAEFLVRIQTRSEIHRELDGAWYRGFDFRRWEYWGSNGDSGWGAWCTETGWTQGWIVAGLALRHRNATLWQLTSTSRIADRFDECRKRMLPEGLPQPPASAGRISHAALKRPVALAAAADPRHPGLGPASLTDGELSEGDCRMPQWMGFFGADLDATVDLGRPETIHRLGASFLQSVDVGIFLPVEVTFAVSDDGRTFRDVAAVKHGVSLREAGPLMRTLEKDGLDLRARYVRVRARNVGLTPDWHPAKGAKAWLFADEVMVNAKTGRGGRSP
jgi:hypothetical protein